MSSSLIVNSEELKNVEDNPYAYLERDFSSENFKIELKNLPKFYGIGEFRKLLNEKLKLNANKIKTIRQNSPFAFICFRSEEDREKAIQVLTKYKWKGNELQAMKAKPCPDPLVKKRKEVTEDTDPNKKLKVDDRSQEERLKDSAIPYWRKPYDEQLKLKQESIKNMLQRLGNSLGRSNHILKNWIDRQKSLYGGLPCHLADIRYSDLVEGYRNKCEFTVGTDEETNLATVGFRIGSYVEGTTGVAPIDSLVHIAPPMKLAVKFFQDFVRASDLEVFNPEFHTGHFRQLMVRSTTDQLMLVVGIHPQDLSEQQLDEFKRSLKDFFSVGHGKEAHVTSLYYQKIVKKAHHDDVIPPEHLMGDTHVYETILGLKFKISPEAFFQINTKAAEILYKAAIELAEPTEKTTILDVCCGTGTIGLCFSKQCSQVLGIELVPQAIVDAKENAELNNIKNAAFFVGKAEEILGSTCFKATGEEITAVVDPPRAGLLKRAVLQMRKISNIHKLVYVSCNPSAAFQNFLDFGRPESKKVHGDALVPTKAIVVDLFPFTKHCELVICFERWEKLSKTLEESEAVNSNS